MTSSGFEYDRERVRTDDLAVILEHWCESSGVDNPIDRMAQLTHVDLRTLYGIRNKKTKTTSIFMADKILTLLGYDFNEVFDDGRLRMKDQRRAVYHKTAVECSTVRPHTKELVERCGGAPQAAEYALVTPQTINRILGSKQCTIQQVTARKLLLALEHRRLEDEEVGKIRDRLRRIRQNDAIVHTKE
jgi:hypothetical protein